MNTFTGDVGIWIAPTSGRPSFRLWLSDGRVNAWGSSIGGYSDKCRRRPDVMKNPSGLTDGLIWLSPPNSSYIFAGVLPYEVRAQLGGHVAKDEVHLLAIAVRLMTQGRLNAAMHPALVPVAARVMLAYLARLGEINPAIVVATKRQEFIAYCEHALRWLRLQRRRAARGVQDVLSAAEIAGHIETICATLCELSPAQAARAQQIRMEEVLCANRPTPASHSLLARQRCTL